MLRLASSGSGAVHSAAAHAALSAARPALSAAQHASRVYRHHALASAVRLNNSAAAPVRLFSTRRSAASSPAAAAAGAAVSSVVSSWSALMARLAAQVPKGWERFFPEGNRGRGVGREGNRPEDAQKAQEAGRDNSSGSNRNNDNQSNNSSPPPQVGIGFLVMSGITAFMLYRILTGERSLRGGEKELTWQEFKTRFLERGLVEKLDVDPTTRKVAVYLKPGAALAMANGDAGSVGDVSGRSTVTASVDQQAADSAAAGGLQSSVLRADGEPTHYFYIGSVESFERSLMETQRDMGVDPHEWVAVRYHSGAAAGSGEGWGSLLMSALMIGTTIYFFRKITSGMGGMMGGRGGGGSPFSNFGKSPAHLLKPGESKVTFADVAGLDEAKVEVMEFVKFLQSPEKFTKLGAKIPKGALLQGPPGTGKTLLAKAVAGEAGVPFWSISGSDFNEMYVGVGSARVRDLFKEARANTPCIIFIDEIDAIGRARGHGPSSGADNERENTLNQLLVEMDGMGTTEGVVVLAGTNRKDMLDKALLRPGRFDRHITIDKPDLRGRAQIFMVHLKPLRCDPKHTHEDLAQRLAALTPGFAGADISNLCNEAALIAARADKEYVMLSDFEQASDRVLGGMEKKGSKMSEEERKLVAHHEAGHAVAAWFLEHADPLLKVTIVPRTSGALGFAQYLPKELSLYHQGQLSDMMAMALGGRAAEQIFFGRVSTGASDDLQKVTKIAQAQVTTYGMSEKLGQVSYAQSNGDSQFVKPFSEATAQAIDEEVRKLIAVTYERTLELLEKHRAQVAALAGKLLELENVNHDVLLEILGPRPFASDAYTSWRKQAKEAQEEAEREKQAKKEAEEKAQQEQDQDPEMATA